MDEREQFSRDATRILLADGDRESRNAMTWCLLSEGFRVDPVADGFDAAAALQRDYLPTIAIIDLGLQGFDGRRLIEHILGSPRLRGIPVIATGIAEPFAPLPREVSFLKKPCPGDVLLAWIRAMGHDELQSFFPSRHAHASGLTPVTSVSGIAAQGDETVERNSRQRQRG